MAFRNRFLALAESSSSDSESDSFDEQVQPEKQETEKPKTKITHVPPTDVQVVQQQKQHKPKSKSRPRQYSLLIGREPIQTSQSAEVQPFTFGSTSNTSIHSISFVGRCFQCHCEAHSQKYCPLRQCFRCKMYGHSESICLQNSSIDTNSLTSTALSFSTDVLASSTISVTSFPTATKHSSSSTGSRES